MELLGIRDLAKGVLSGSVRGTETEGSPGARSLCYQRTLLLLDEPVTGLDPIVTSEFISSSADQPESGIAVVMVSHDIESAVEDASISCTFRRRCFVSGPRRNTERAGSGGNSWKARDRGQRGRILPCRDRRG